VMEVQGSSENGDLLDVISKFSVKELCAVWRHKVSSFLVSLTPVPASEDVVDDR